MIKRYRGDDYPVVAYIKINGVAVDLTTFTSMTFTYTNSDGSTSTIEGVFTDAVNGEVTFTPGAGDFQTSGTFRYDIQGVDGNSKVRTYDLNQLKILPDINKT